MKKYKKSTVLLTIERILNKNLTETARNMRDQN